MCIRDRRYIANATTDFRELIRTLRKGPESTENRVPGLDVWLARTLSELDLPAGKASDWASFSKRDPGLADSARGFLVVNGRSLPTNIPTRIQRWFVPEIVRAT